MFDPGSPRLQGTPKMQCLSASMLGLLCTVACRKGCRMIFVWLLSITIPFSPTRKLCEANVWNRQTVTPKPKQQFSHGEKRNP